MSHLFIMFVCILVVTSGIWITFNWSGRDMDKTLILYMQFCIAKSIYLEDHSETVYG